MINFPSHGLAGVGCVTFFSHGLAGMGCFYDFYARAGQDGLVLIAADAEALGSDLKWEQSRGGALFPHLYGALNIGDVTWVRDLPLGPDGMHQFPEM